MLKMHEDRAIIVKNWISTTLRMKLAYNFIKY